jgi:uncharacterized protein YrrD
VGSYDGGDGSEGSPFEIRTAEQLNEIGQHSEDWGSYFILTDNIDLSGFTGTDFNMIGVWIEWADPGNNPFTGVVDGRGHIISDFTYTSTGTDGIGLFGYIGIGGEVSNLRLVNANVSAGTGVFVGSLAGANVGSISECWASGSISGTGYVGGLVGGSGGTISFCCASGNVTGSDIGFGGLVGSNGGAISNCYATSSVIGDECLGGLVGYNDSNGSISYCYASGSVSGDDDLGGLLGVDGGGGSYTSSFWDVTVNPSLSGISNISDPVGVIGRTTEEMQTKSTFTDYGWDFVGESTNGFADIWRMPFDMPGYPILSCQVGADINGDSRVDLSDFGIVSAGWMEAGCDGDNNFCSWSDIDLSGDVNLDDLLMLAERWLEGVCFPTPAFGPDPADGMSGVNPNTELSWSAGGCAVSHNIYFGTSSPGEFQGNQTETTFDPRALELGTMYYWRIDEVQADSSVIEGDVWSFTTGDFVGWWELDESSGTVASDSVGGHDGTLMGNPTWWPSGGKIGGALEFDGVGDYVEIEGYKGISGSNPRTVTAWVRAESNGSSLSIVRWGTLEINGGLWSNLITADGKLRAAVIGGSVVGDTTINDDTWHHVAIVLPDKEDVKVEDIRFYVDGEHEDTTVSFGSQTIDTGVDMDVLISLDGSVGLLDDVRIYNYAMSTGEIRTLAGFPPELVAHWELDESGGTVACDSSGNGNDGTLHGNPTWLPNNGQLGGALGFDGDGDYVEVEGYKGISGSNPRTITAWVRTVSYAPNLTIVRWGTEEINGGLWSNVIDANGELRAAVWGGSIVGSTDIDDNTWHHVAIVLPDKDDVKVEDILLYVDGEQEYTTISFGAQTIDTAVGMDVLISSDGSCGLLDDVRIYNYALNEEDIGAMVRGPSFGPDPADGAPDVNTRLALSWSAGVGAVSHNIYFGTSSPGEFKGNQTETTFDPGALELETMYYWRIDEVQGDSSVVEGDVWRFTTRSDMLVGWWELDESSGTVVSDSVGGHDGVLMGDPVWRPSGGRIGGALEFDGVGDYVEIEGYKGISGGNPRTVTAWVKTEPNGSTFSIVRWGALGINGGLWSNVINAEGKLRAAVIGGSVVGDTTINDDTWHNVAIVLPDKDDVKVEDILLYVDGEPEGMTVSSGSQTIDTAIYLDVSIATDGSKGMLDDVRIYNYAMSEEEIGDLSCILPAFGPSPTDGASGVNPNTELSWSAGVGAVSHDIYFGTSSPGEFQGNQTDTTFDPGPLDCETMYYWRIDEVQVDSSVVEGDVWKFTTRCPVGWWELDESSGTVASDSVGGNDGTLNGDPVWWPSGGKIGGALEFDGVGDYVEVAGYKGISGGNPRTVSAWVKVESTGSTFSIVRWGTEAISGGVWSNVINADGKLRAAVVGGSVVGGTTINDNTWHHVAIVLPDKEDVKVEDILLYVDGEQESTTISLGSQTIDTAVGMDVLISLDGSVGLLDDVRIYNYALSEGEIGALAGVL